MYTEMPLGFDIRAARVHDDNELNSLIYYGADNQGWSRPMDRHLFKTISGGSVWYTSVPGLNWDLFSDLQQPLSIQDGLTTCGVGSAVIAVSLLYSEGDNTPDFVSLGEVRSSVSSDRWEILGYDAVDFTKSSPLCESIETLSVGLVLNNNGLIDDPAAARLLCDIVHDAQHGHPRLPKSLVPLSVRLVSEESAAHARVATARIATTYDRRDTLFSVEGSQG